MSEAAKARPRYKLISCNVFQREICAAISRSRAVVDLEFLELGLHARSGDLRLRLQERVDAADAASASAASSGSEPYDAILLGYGLCGNGLVGLSARSLPLVLARAHDCCTILLGSRASFLERFGSDLSHSWSSSGYVDRGQTYFRATELGQELGFDRSYEQMVEEYGEDNARYLWETLHPERVEKELYFIETEESAGLGYADEMRARAAEEGKDFVLLRGDSRLIRGLLSGEWPVEEYLVVPPGARIAGLYDHERIMTAEASAEPN